ncbi:unnamed protein product [Enterobius vermicularis]|uniref:ANK_REP_REGION domain-containing protein n=1 Tax=Enterobius vermicularis TaxID=51028 RepID=A0A0N4VM45_ENTVE|nr:unnamed protein product [Enterobius vermicularis]
MIYNIAADLITKVDIAETFEIFANLKLYFKDGSLEGKKQIKSYCEQLCGYSAKGYVDSIRRLLKDHYESNGEESRRAEVEALSVACEKGHIKVVEVLLEHKVKVGEKNVDVVTS